MEGPGADDLSAALSLFEATDDNLEKRFRRQYPMLWSATLFGPLALTIALLILIGIVAGWDYLGNLLVMAAASLWVFGRFVILGGTDPDVAEMTGKLSSLELFGMVLYLDIAVAAVLAFHLGFLFRLPWLGRKLQLLVIDGRFILEHQPWIRRATFAGLIAFVSFPLAATGSVGGSIFGRLLGLSRGLTFWGIAMGSLIGDGIMLFAADSIGSHLNKNHPVVKYGGMAVVLVLILILESRYRQLRTQFAERHAAEIAEPSAADED